MKANPLGHPLTTRDVFVLMSGLTNDQRPLTIGEIPQSNFGIVLEFSWGRNRECNDERQTKPKGFVIG